MTHDDRVKVARAIRALKTEAPATLTVLRALSGLESLMPRPGTPEARAAWVELGAPLKSTQDTPMM